MEVRLTQEQLKLWNQPSSVTPHVTLAVSRGYQVKDIGPIITYLKMESGATVVESSQGEELWLMGTDEFCWKRNGETGTATFKVVNLPETQRVEASSELRDRVPACLWMTDPNDVG